MCLRKGMENVFSRNSLTIMHGHNHKVWKMLVCKCRSHVCLHPTQKRKGPFSLKIEVNCILLLVSLLLFLLTDMANFFCMCSRIDMFIMCAGNSWLAGVWFQRLFIVQLCSSSSRGWTVGSSYVSCGCVCIHTACERTSHITQIVTLLNCMLPQ